MRDRHVAMVCQQLINPTAMTMADDIASPQRLRKEYGTLLNAWKAGKDR